MAAAARSREGLPGRPPLAARSATATIPPVTATPATQTGPQPEAPAAPPDSQSVIIRPWPKVVFLYPTFIIATICFLVSALRPAAEGQLGVPGLGNFFLLLFALNLLVFSFDFSRIKSITLLILVVALVLLVLWADTKWEVVGWLGRVVNKIDIQMNTAFYGFLSGFLALVLLLVLINSRFNYYEVNHREILHHHGYLGDVTRWPTDNLLMNKEIYDLVEFLLLRSGRLVFLPANAKEAIVIDNVIGVNRIEERIKDLLSVMAVRMSQRRPGS